MIEKNVAGQGVYLYAYDTVNRESKLGDSDNITARLSKDGGVAVTTTTEHPVEIDAGIYWQPFSQAETNANAMSIVWISGTVGVVINPIAILTDRGRVDDVLEAIEDIDAAECAGSGDIPVDHNYGGTDALRVLSDEGAPLERAVITAYIKSDYDAGHRNEAWVRGRTQTGVDGRWVVPLMLLPGIYTLITFRGRHYGSKSTTITVA